MSISDLSDEDAKSILDELKQPRKTTPEMRDFMSECKEVAGAIADNRIDLTQINKALKLSRASLELEGVIVTDEHDQLVRDCLTGKISEEEFMKIALERAKRKTTVDDKLAVLNNRLFKVETAVALLKDKLKGDENGENR